jgi:hypothetical protein
MTRAEILTETLARLEAERFAGPRRVRYAPTSEQTLPPVTEAQAMTNAHRLMDALSDDPMVVAWAEKETA